MSRPVLPPPLPTKTKTVIIGNNGAKISCEILDANTKTMDNFCAALEKVAVKSGIGTKDQIPVVISDGIYLMNDASDFDLAKTQFESGPISVAFYAPEEAAIYKEMFSKDLESEAVEKLKMGRPDVATVAKSYSPALPPKAQTRE